MTDIRTVIAAERTELADLLAGLPGADWDRPSLCAGWRVREVVAHIAMPFLYSTPRFLLGMIRARGKFDVFADQAAKRDAARYSPSGLTSLLRRNANHPWKPPGGRYEDTLSHDVLHGCDITVALGLDRLVPLERMELLLRDIRPHQVAFFGVDLTGVQLRATDLDWSYGTGEPLTGRAQDLLLVLSGRKLPVGRLEGEERCRFSTDAA